METDDELTLEAIDRLRFVLPRRSPQFWASLNGPVSDEDLDALRAEVAPWELPSSLVSWLKFADGQDPETLTWWPTMVCGPMLTARGMAQWHHLQTTQLLFPHGFLTITHEGHEQSSLELVTTRAAVHLQTGVTDAWRVISPSLGATLSVTTILAEEGLLDEPWPEVYSEQPWRRARELFEQLDWAEYPIAPYTPITTEQYLPEWGPPGHVGDR